jgi:hypothetical protein
VPCFVPQHLVRSSLCNLQVPSKTASSSSSGTMVLTGVPPSITHHSKPQHLLLLQCTQRQQHQLPNLVRGHACPQRGRQSRQLLQTPWHPRVVSHRSATPHGTVTHAHVSPRSPKTFIPYIPFTVSPSDAEAYFQEYQQANPLLASPQVFDSVGSHLVVGCCRNPRKQQRLY